MNKRYVVLGVMLCGLLCCLALLFVQFPEPARDLTLDQAAPPAGEQAQPLNGGTGVPPPKRGNCENVGQDYAENPFRGWPLLFYEGDWRTVSAWWCDPMYAIDFGAAHWGIDIASHVELRETGEAVYVGPTGAEVVCTLPEDGYGYVISAREDGGWHFGMGNHVKVMALTCEETCGEKPPQGDLEPGEVVFVLEEDASQCARGGTPPAPGETPPPPADPDDLLLACEELGWVATYMHLESIAVQPLELVERGQVLGRVDSTGNSSGPHLHYQINGPGVGAIDPAPAMCGSYTDDIRAIPRWQRSPCGG